MSERTDLVVPAGVAWSQDLDEDGRPRVYVARMPGGPISVLPQESALIWLAGVEGSQDPLPQRVADRAGVAVDQIRDEVLDFVDRLVHEGLLERSSRP